MKKTTRFCAMLTALALVLVMIMTMAGCANTGNSDNSGNGANNSDSERSTYPTQLYDKNGDPVQMPTDNDDYGWFSVEVVNQYSVPSFTQPEGTTVVSKPEPSTLYLKGNDKTFRDSVLYAFEAIKTNNTTVYLPELSIGEDSVASVTSLKPITHIDTDTLYPNGDVLELSIIYKSGHKAYECTITLQSNNEQVCISFADRTQQYLPLM